MLSCGSCNADVVDCERPASEDGLDQVGCNPCNSQYFLVFILCSCIKLIFTPSPDRRHLSCDDCLGDKSEDYQNCSVLYCVPQLYTVISTHI